jgi:aspartyl protease family protein
MGATAMPKTEGPWGRKPSPIRVGPQQRLPILIGLILAGGLALWEISRLFPEAISSDRDQVRLINLIGFLLLLSVGIVFGRRFTARDTFRNIALWCGVFAVLGLIFAYRDELQSVGNRIRSELVPGYPVATGAHEMTISASEDGGFFIEGEVNNAPAHFLIDTGATDIVLSPAAAERAGIDLAGLSYTSRFETAHGTGWGASTVLSRLVVGPIELHDVRVSINKSPMDSSLLGLAFLKQLESFEVRGGRLTLRWRS